MSGREQGDDMARFKNSDWNLPETPIGGHATWDAVKVAVLMDIRDELQRLNGVIGCANFIRIPRVLDQIVANTKKPGRRKKKK